MEQKIVFIKVKEFKSKDGDKFFKCLFLTDNLEPHEQYISSDLMSKIVNNKYEALHVYKGLFGIDKDMKLHLNDIN